MKERCFLLAVVMLIGLVCSSCAGDPIEEARKAAESGDAYFAEKKHAEAIVEYGRALQQDPRAGQVRFKLAQIHDRLGDPVAAGREYIRAADLLPEDPNAQFYAGLFLLASRSFEDAKARALNAIRINPKHVEAHLLLAEATAMMNDVNAAVSQIEQTIKIDPGDSRSYGRMGRYELAKGDVAKAETWFKRAVDVAPGSVEPPLALARFYLNLNRIDEAEIWLKKAKGLSPKDPQVNRTLAALYISSRRAAEAEEPMKIYAETAPSAAGHITLADYYFSQNRWKDARRALEPLQGNKVFGGAAITRLAILEAAEGRESEAFKLLDQAITTSGGKNIEALVMRGRLLTAKGRYSEATVSLSAAVAAEPGNAEARYYLGVAHVANGDMEQASSDFMAVLKLQPAESASMMQLAQIYLQQGKATAARTLANDAVRANPSNGQARLIAAQAFIADGDFKSASREARLVATSLPNLPEPHFLLGQIALAQREFSVAEREYRQAYQMTGGNPQALAGLINTLVAAGRLEDARALINEQIAKYPKRADLYVTAARVARAQNDPSGVQLSLQRAVDIDKSNLAAAQELAQLYIEQQKYDRAKKQLREMLTLAPNDVTTNLLMALAHERSNDRAGARQQYEKVLQIDPHSVTANNNLAMLYIMDGENLDLALQYAKEAKAAHPNAPEIDDTLGMAYLKKNLPDRAIAAFTDAVAKDQKNAVYMYHLGLAHSQRGQQRQARETFERALKLSPTFDGSEDARARLSRDQAVLGTDGINTTAETRLR